MKTRDGKIFVDVINGMTIADAGDKHNCSGTTVSNIFFRVARDLQKSDFPPKVDYKWYDTGVDIEKVRSDSDPWLESMRKYEEGLK